MTKKKKNKMGLGMGNMDLGMGDIDYGLGKDGWNPSIDSTDIQSLTKEISGGINAVKKGYGAVYGNKIANYFEKRNRPKKLRRAKMRIFLDNMKNKISERDGVDWFQNA